MLKSGEANVFLISKVSEDGLQNITALFLIGIKCFTEDQIGIT